MRRLSQGLAALVLAGSAALAGTTSASAGGPLVNVVIEDVLSHNQVIVLQNATVAAAAALCDIDVNVLSAQLDRDGKGNCPALTNVTQVAKVVNA
jgi:hypothetical protein